MGTMNIYNTSGGSKASLTFTGSSDVTVDSNNLSGLTGNVQTQLNNKVSSKVLQVIQTVKTDTFSTTTGTTYVDITGMSASITPSSTSSKILVMVQLVAGLTYAGDNARVKLQRNGADIYTGADTTNHPAGFQQLEFSQYGTAGQYSQNPMIAIFLDSPSTTSSTTYKVQAKVDSTTSVSTLRYNIQNSSGSVMILMEIAA